MFCKICGSEVQQGMKFCTKCGNPIEYQVFPQTVAPLPVVKPKTRSIAIAVVTGFLCAFLTLCIVIGLIYLAVGRNINEDLVDSITNEDTGYDVSTIEMKTSEGEQVSLYEYIEKEYNVDLEDSADITEKDLEKILNKPIVREFVNNVLSGYIDYVVTGDKIEPVSRDTVIDFLKKNKKSIYKQLGDYFEQGSLDNVEESFGDEIDEVFKKIDTDEISLGWIKKNVGVDLKQISGAFSIAKWLIFTVIGVLVLAVILVNIKYLLSGFNGVFISLLAAGIITTVFSAVVRFFYEFKDGEIMSMILKPIITSLLIIGVIGMVTGIVLVVVLILIRRFFIEKRR